MTVSQPARPRRINRYPPGSAEAFTEAIEQAVASFGRTIAPRLRAEEGSAEDSLRGPLEQLLDDVATVLGLDLVAHPEARLAPLSARPDYAVDIGGARVGVVELKAPGKGVPRDGRWGTKHDREQWDKLKVLPNVLYTDGNQWALYRQGKRVGDVARLLGELTTAGQGLRPADHQFGAILRSFLEWTPTPPPSLPRLLATAAGLCRLLRDEVRDTLEHELRGRSEPLFTRHMDDWQRWLFPQLTGDDFADAYAQTVTFGLLLARREGVTFEDLEISDIGERLAKRHLLVGRALSVLTARPDRHRGMEERSVVLQTMRRVIGAVDPDQFNTGPGTYHWLYEEFLESYDASRRKKSGSYYTPEPVTAFMTRFVDDVLRSRLARTSGLAENDVVVVDPAMGTGTFLLSVVERVAELVRADGGDVPASLRALLGRLIGFEKQIGPYAVAELKLHQLLGTYGTEAHDEDVRFYVTDTLDNPSQQIIPSGAHYQPLADSREQANRVKLEVPVVVVVGNPPYGERAKAQGGWILERHSGRHSLLDDFRLPGAGRQDYKLHNLYCYFWRWATWKVFEAHRDDPAGVVAFITTSAYTTGGGFAGMRRYLREIADEGWIIDLSPEGHQSAVATRIFPGTQHEICIGIFTRSGAPRHDTPARVHYHSISGAQHEKFDALLQVHLDDTMWRDCPTGWGAAFRPVAGDEWTAFSPLSDVMPWNSLGVTPNRTWVYAPDHETLTRRWRRFLAAPADEKRILMKETQDRTIGRKMPASPLGGASACALRDEHVQGPSIEPIAYRSFDRQYLITDRRVVDRVRPSLWSVRGARQIFLVTHDNHALTAGPAAVFAAHVPDTDHFLGHHGGRVAPLYRDDRGEIANFAPGLLPHLSRVLGTPVAPEDAFAYVAAVLSHSAYTEHFHDDLRQAGPRLPLTADLDLWQEAMQIGREVIWLHTYGERCANAAEGRPPGPPRTDRPKVTAPIPGTTDAMPDELRYESSERTLFVGTGALAPVSPEAWSYEISGTKVVKKWFGYRQRTPRRRRSSPLDDIHAAHWTVDTTEQLRDLLAVLERCVVLEARQQALLDEICCNPLITTVELENRAILPPPPSARKPPSTQQPQPVLHESS